VAWRAAALGDSTLFLQDFWFQGLRIRVFLDCLTHLANQSISLKSEKAVQRSCSRLAGL
jgi:hypothetical protein